MAAGPTVSFDLLERYLHVTDKAPEEAILSVPLTDLLKEDTMRQLLELGREQYKATSMELPASFLGLSLFSLCGAIHYVSAINDAWLDLNPDNVNFFLESHGDHVHAGYQLQEVRLAPLPESNRDEALKEAYERYFTEHFNALLLSIAETAGVKPDMIWSQYAARLTYMQDFLLENETRTEIRERYIAGHRVLTAALEPDVFGRRRNPFHHMKPVYLDSPYEPGRQLLMRSSCCMYFKREGGEMCFNCPRMREEDRERLRQEKLAARNK